MIGVDEYEDDGVSRLKGAVNDAEALAGTLEQYAAFPPDQIVVLTSDRSRHGGRATKKNIKERLGGILRAITLGGNNGLLFVAFAGHGKVIGDELYLLPTDVDADEIKETAIKANDIRDMIQEGGVQQVIIALDACRNEPLLARSAEDNHLTEAYTRAFNFGNRNRGVKAFAILYATEIGHRAYEYQVGDKMRGYFTYALEEAFKGVAGAANALGEVTLQSLVDYLQDVVPKRMLVNGMGPRRTQRPFAIIEGFKASDLLLTKIQPSEQLAENSPPRKERAEPAPPKSNGGALGGSGSITTRPRVSEVISPYGERTLFMGLPEEISRLVEATKAIHHLALGLDGAWVLVESGGTFSSGNVPVDFSIDLAGLQNPLEFVAFAPDGGWVIVQGENGYRVRGVPVELVEALKEANRKGVAILDVDFHPNGGWAVVTGDKTTTSGVPADVRRILVEVTKNHGVSKVAFSSKGWAVIPTSGGYFTSNIPGELLTALQEARKLKRTVLDIQITDADGWALLTGAPSK